MTPNWHPNFRIESSLPDTRTIHTRFLIKAVLYTTALILTAFLAQREYQAYLLRKTIRGLDQQIQNASSANRSRLAKSEQFRKQAIAVKEVQQFFKVPLIPHETVVELSSIKPEKLLFTSLALSESTIQVKRGKRTRPMSLVVFKLNILGSVQDLPVLTQFKRELEESQRLNPSGYNVSIDETIEQRDADGTIPFELIISLNPTGKDSK